MGFTSENSALTMSRLVAELKKHGRRSIPESLPALADSCAFFCGARPHYLSRRDRLAGVALRMVRHVNQQPADGRRQRSSPHRPGRFQIFRRGKRANPLLRTP